MSDSATPATEVLTAAKQLVEAFGSFDKASYFASFRDDASFIFYNSDVVFPDRASYEKAWDAWVAEGWKVLDCTSSGGAVKMLNDNTGLFTHEVFTTIDTPEGPNKLHERETIVFSREPSRSLGVHEHLSSFPG